MPRRLNPRLGQAAGIGEMKRELPTNVYRVDPSGRLDIVVTEDLVPDPNGLTFSPDYKKLYVMSTGKGPGDTGPGGKSDVHVFDVGADNKLSNHKLFTDCMVDGVTADPTARAATSTAMSGSPAMPAATSAITA